MTLKLGMQHRVLKNYPVFPNDNCGLTLVDFTEMSYLVSYVFVWEKVKSIYFLESSRWSQLNEYMKLYKYHRSRSFIDFGRSHSDSTFSNFFSLLTAMPIKAKFYMQPPWDEGIKVYTNGFMSHDQNGRHAHNMVKAFKIVFSGTKRPMTLKLGMQHW